MRFGLTLRPLHTLFLKSCSFSFAKPAAVISHAPSDVIDICRVFFVLFCADAAVGIGVFGVVHGFVFLVPKFARFGELWSTI